MEATESVIGVIFWEASFRSSPGPVPLAYLPPQTLAARKA